jgi:hypothetical protein
MSLQITESARFTLHPALGTSPQRNAAKHFDEALRQIPRA